MKKLFTLFLLLTLLLVSPMTFSEEWLCPNCGNPATDNFCAECGAPRPSEEWSCPECNQTNTGNFCSSCGVARPKGLSSASEEMVSVTLSTGKEISIRKSVKDALDAYEALMDGYKDAINNMSEGNTTAYMTFWTQYTEMAQKVEEIEGELTDDENLYYLEVATRVLQKMY